MASAVLWTLRRYVAKFDMALGLISLGLAFATISLQMRKSNRPTNLEHVTKLVAALIASTFALLTLGGPRIHKKGH